MVKAMLLLALMQEPKRNPCWELQDFFVPTFLDPSTLNAQMEQQAHFPGFHPAGQQFEDPFGNAYVPVKSSYL
jgi:hypothetical protein